MIEHYKSPYERPTHYAQHATVLDFHSMKKQKQISVHAKLPNSKQNIILTPPKKIKWSFMKVLVDNCNFYTLFFFTFSIINWEIFMAEKLQIITKWNIKVILKVEIHWYTHDEA